MKKNTLLLLAALVAGGAFADIYWTGRTLSDWSAEGAWTGTGNNVFGGNGTYLTSTDPHVVLFSKPETITRLWIENNDKGKIVWKLADEATEDAGLTMTGPNDKWGHAMNVGTGKHGELVIESGTYNNNGQLWLANGDADSQMTLNGGSYIISSYTCIAYGSGKGKGTLTVNGGLYKETGGAFIVCQSSNGGAVGELNQTGGEVITGGEVWLAERAGKGVMNISGGTFTVGSYMSAPRGGSTTGEINLTGGKMICNNTFQLGYGGTSTGSLMIDGGELDAKGYFFTGCGGGSTDTVELKSGTLTSGDNVAIPYGSATTRFVMSGGNLKAKKYFYAGWAQNAKATLEMSGGTLDTDDECILGCGTGSDVEMTLTGGTFTPKKFWIGSQWQCSSDGLTAKFTMTDGTLTTDNDQDLVVGGRSNANGTYEMEGGIANIGNILYVGWQGHGVMTMSGGDVYIRAGKSMSLGSNQGGAQSSRVEMTGGTIHTDTVDMQTQYPAAEMKSFLVDGGAFAPVTDTTAWLSTAALTVGENGIGLDSDGHAATLGAALAKAEGVETLKAVFTGAKAAGVISFAETTLDAIDAFEIAKDGVMVVNHSTTLAKPLTIAEGGKLVVDVTGLVTTDGDYELVTLAEGSEVKISNDNMDLVGLPGVATLDFTAEGRVVKVNVSGLERLVLNVDGGEWTGATTWKGEKSGVVRAFSAKDKAALIVSEDNTVKTVLVNEEITPMGVEVEATGENSYALVKGHGTFKPQELSVKGTIAFAGDEEGPLNLDVKLESTMDGDTNLSKALFAEGTVNLLTSLHMPSTVNGTLIRETDWTPSYPIDGTGEIQIKNCKLTLDTTQPLKNFAGTVTLGPGATLDDAKDLNQAAVFGSAKLKMNGATINRFSWNDASENLNDVIVADGTENTWWNNQSRGNQGAHVNINGDISGGGKLIIRQKGWEPARCCKFNACTFEDFTGTIEMNGINYEFWKPVKSGTFIFQGGAAVGSATPNISIDKDVTWLMNNADDYNLTCLAGATIGGNGNAILKSLTLNENVKFKFTADGALSNPKAEYVAITVTNPITGPLPTIANDTAVTSRGQWKLVQRANMKTVTDESGVESEEVESYSLVATFRPNGLLIIFQ